MYLSINGACVYVYVVYRGLGICFLHAYGLGHVNCSCLRVWVYICFILRAWVMYFSIF